MRRRRSRAFTLVEMVVATVLLFVGGVAAMICLSAATRATGAAEERSRAAFLAERRLSELESDPTSITGGEQQGDFGDEYRNYTWATFVEPTDLANVVRVTVTVTWTSGTWQRSARFVTMMYAEPNQ